jgi:ribonuclease HII
VSTPTLDLEQLVRSQQNLHTIAGLDEAGRGALAGPVVAAAVILPLDEPQHLEPLCEVNDSKQLTAVIRERLYSLIIENVLTYGIGSTPASVVDEIGIIPATKQAMRMAISQLTPTAGYLLIDGRIRLKSLPTPQQSIIRGDEKSLSIAAASILAKVTRDRQMIQMDSRYPQYGFAQHKGYGTAYHLSALERHGPCAVHRYSFSPIRLALL